MRFTGALPAIASMLALVASTPAAGAIGTEDARADLVPAAAHGSAAPEALRRLTETGVGRLRIGRTLAALRAEGLVGAPRLGCDIVSPPYYWAPLRRPLAGSAWFRGNAPRSRLELLAFRGGVVTERGIRIGSTAQAIRRAYPRVRAMKSAPNDPIQINAFVVERAGKSRFWFALSARDRVEFIAVPSPLFCE